MANMDEKCVMIEAKKANNESQENKGMQKDSTRSWLVCVGGILLVGFSLGINNSFGVLFVCWVREFQESRTIIAWIGSFEFIWFMCLSPVCGILTRYFSFRPVVLLGCVLLCLGLLISSFVNDIAWLYVTYGLIFGTGTCFLYMSSIVVLPFCFSKHLATSTGLVSAAIGGFTMWYSPLYEYLIMRYGWRATLRIVSLLIVPLLAACALFPRKSQVPSERKELEGEKFKVWASFRRLLKNKGFLTWVVLMTLVYLGLFVPLVHLISFCQDIGIPTYISVYNITLMCGMETFAKALSGKMIDIFYSNVHTYNILSTLTLAVSITLLPLAKSTAPVFTFAAIYGFAFGVQSICVIIITPQLTHPEDSKHAITYLFGILSVPGGAGPVLAAWIFDVTRSYHLAFYIAGGFFACAACLGTLIKLLASRNATRSYDNVLTTKNQIIKLRECQG